MFIMLTLFSVSIQLLFALLPYIAPLLLLLFFFSFLSVTCWWNNNVCVSKWNSASAILSCGVILSVDITAMVVDDGVGDVDDSPRQSPKLPARIKPNYRQRKMRKTGLSTVELQKVMPELSDLMSSKQSSLAACVSCLRCCHSFRLRFLYSAVTQ